MDNILSIAASEPSMLTNLTKAQITIHNDKYDDNPVISFALELEKVVNTDGDTLYVTHPFQPPRRAFKIEVSIYDVLTFTQLYTFITEIYRYAQFLKINNRVHCR